MTAALCWCEVIAAGRCATCRRAFCMSHGGHDRCSRCAAQESLRGCHCGENPTSVCARCGERVCDSHAQGRPETQERWEADYPHRKCVETSWVCTRCVAENNEVLRAEEAWDRSVRAAFKSMMTASGFPGSREIRDEYGHIHHVWPFESCRQGQDNISVTIDVDGSRYEGDSLSSHYQHDPTWSVEEKMIEIARANGLDLRIGPAPDPVAMLSHLRENRDPPGRKA